MALQNFAPPSKKFSLIRYAADTKDKRSLARTLVGDSVALVGWIPHYESKEDLPDGFLRSQWSSDSGIKPLLETGNAIPPSDFRRGPKDFQRFVRTNDFRGAIAIDQPTFYLSREGSLLGADFMVLANVGATRVRVGKKFEFKFDGVSEASGQIEHTGNSLAIRAFLRIKLSPAGQLVAKWITGTWPPWATLMIEYRVDFGLERPRAQVCFAGTSVPSQLRYIRWEKLDSEYRMEEHLSESSYERFINAGNCQDAPSSAFRTPADLTSHETTDFGSGRP